MLEHFFSQPAALQRLRAGPLGSHIDSFAARLSKRGYKKGSAKAKIELVSHLSEWLERRRVRLEGLDEQTVIKFLHDRQKHFRACRGVRSTLHQLLDHLSETGVVTRSAPESEDSAIQRALGDFERYLLQERGLSESTLINYRSFARRFLRERFGAGAIQLDQLAPSDVTQFVLRYTHIWSARRVQLLVSGLRSFLRFLFLREDTATELAALCANINETLNGA